MSFTLARARTHARTHIIVKRTHHPGRRNKITLIWRILLPPLCQQPIHEGILLLLHSCPGVVRRIAHVHAQPLTILARFILCLLPLLLLRGTNRGDERSDECKRGGRVCGDHRANEAPPATPWCRGEAVADDRAAMSVADYECPSCLESIYLRKGAGNQYYILQQRPPPAEGSRSKRRGQGSRNRRGKSYPCGCSRLSVRTHIQFSAH